MTGKYSVQLGWCKVWSPDVSKYHEQIGQICCSRLSGGGGTWILNKNLVGFAPATLPLYPLNKIGEHILWNRGVWKVTPKCPLVEFKSDPFSRKQTCFDLLIAILVNCIQSQKQLVFFFVFCFFVLFFCFVLFSPPPSFLWSCMCTTLFE